MIKNNPFPKIYTELKCLWKKIREIEQSPPGSGVLSIQEGDNITVDNTDPQNPVVSSTGGGGIESVTGDLVDNTDPLNPIVNTPDLSGYIQEPTTDGTSGQVLTTDGSGGRSWTTVSGGGDGVQSIVPGDNITVDNSDPQNPVINSLGGGGDTNTIESVSLNGTPTTPDGNKNVDIPVFSTSGAGLVPARVGAVTTKYLREDGTWVTPTNTTYSAMNLTELNAGTATTARTTSAKVLTDWLNGKISTAGFSGSYDDLDDKPNIPEQVNLTGGTNVTIAGAYPNLTINSTASGVETIYIELTKTQLDTAIANSELIPGVLYKITEVETWMKQGDTTKAIYLHAISTNELEKKGTGEFYVPKYNQGVAGYGIWSGELWQKTRGAMGTEPSYNKDDIVIWGGKHWRNLTGDYGTFIDHYELDDVNWEEIPVNDTSVEVTYYDVRINIIEYDYANDMITYRKDEAGNEVSTSYENWKDWENIYFNGDPLSDSNYNPTKIVQWGNELDYNSYVGVGTNIVENGVFECINQRGATYENTIIKGILSDNTLNGGYIINNNIKFGNIYYNTLNSGNISNNNVENGSYIYNNTLNNGTIINNSLDKGFINDNIIENNGRIESNTITNGYIRLGTSNPINNKMILLLTVNTGDIGGELGMDLSSATLVYEDFERIVFKNSTGVTKIRYIDEKGDLVVADLMD